MTREFVGLASELRDRRLTMVEIDGKRIGVYSVGSSFTALLDRCPHAGAPLCSGSVSGTTLATGRYQQEWVKDGQILQCPWHGWEFDLATGQTVTEPIRRARTYRVEEEEGRVYLHMDARVAGR
jgi:nitrite reductase (NADH) small subunit